MGNRVRDAHDPREQQNRDQIALPEVGQLKHERRADDECVQQEVRRLKELRLEGHHLQEEMHRKDDEDADREHVQPIPDVLLLRRLLTCWAAARRASEQELHRCTTARQRRSDSQSAVRAVEEEAVRGGVFGVSEDLGEG